MKFVIDLNLSPAWVPVLEAEGWEAVHWSRVGNLRAADSEIMDWARKNGYIVFTHDLGFGELLALTGACGPSVVQLRTAEITPAKVSSIVIAALRQCSKEILSGALVSIDIERTRLRLLPFGTKEVE